MPTWSGTRLLAALTRKIDGTPFLWTCHHVGVNSAGNNDNAPAGTGPADRTAIAWYKIRTSPTVSLVLTGRVYDAATTNPRSYYYPSLAVNKRGDMLLGFSGSSVNDYISAFYTGILNSGSMPSAPVLFYAGKDWFDANPNLGIRWGDYSFTSTDPDGLTMWTIQEYAETPRFGGLGTQNVWGTRISAITPF